MVYRWEKSHMVTIVGSLEGLLISNVCTLVIQQFYFQVPNLRYQPYMFQ